MNKYWFILNGVGRSGKDSFRNFLSKYAKVKSISTVDVIKKVCLELYWDGEKDDKGRKALSDFKDLASKHFNHSYKYVKAQLNDFLSSDYEIFTVDVREPEEIKKLVNDFNFKTILIKRNLEHTPNNHADENVSLYQNYDYVIENYGTLEDLDSKAFEFLSTIRSKE